MSEREILNTHQKALAVNLDRSVYGTLAEIGAGQETARWFFRVGGAASTVAKAISAYDMTFSDAIYGESPRYVSRDRLDAMLAHEYQQVIERLDPKEGEETTFFAFANTVATKSYSYKKDGGGWIGIRFQAHPKAEPSQVCIHTRLKGRDGTQDQETTGILGVNLIHGTMFMHDQPVEILKGLIDGLDRQQLDVDLVDFSGPAFEGIDNRLMALHLVQHGLCNNTMFMADGRVVSAADVLYKKAVLVERSRFRPPTHLTIDMLDCAQQAFTTDIGIDDNQLMVFTEITLENLTEDGGIEVEDFLQRVELLSLLGKNVMISNYGDFYPLAEHLFKHTTQPIAIVMGIPTLRGVFDEKFYEERLAGGILECLGRTFRNGLRFYVCPYIDPKTRAMTALANFAIEPHLQPLLEYLKNNDYIRSLDTIKADYLSFHTQQVLADIRDGNDAWKTAVPTEVAAVIEEKQLFR